MPFKKANLKKEREELENLIAHSEEAKQAYDAFQAMLALQTELSEAR